MTRESSSVTLSQDLFDRFWRALVSKRKARRLEIDRESAWQQLGRAGMDAEFLRAGAKNAKRDSPAEASIEALVGVAAKRSPKAEREPGRRKTATALGSMAGKGSVRKTATNAGTGKRRTTAATRSGERRAGKQ